MTTRLEDVFAEQSIKLPNGPLALLVPPEVKIAERIPTEAVGLLQEFLVGKLGTFEFASKVEALRRKVAPDGLEP